MGQGEEKDLWATERKRKEWARERGGGKGEGEEAQRRGEEAHSSSNVDQVKLGLVIYSF